MSAEPCESKDPARNRPAILIHTTTIEGFEELDRGSSDYFYFFGSRCMDVGVMFAVRLMEPSKQIRIIFCNVNQPVRHINYTDLNWDEVSASPTMLRDICKCLLLWAVNPPPHVWSTRARDLDISMAALSMVTDMHRVAGKERPAWFSENMRDYSDDLRDN